MAAHGELDRIGDHLARGQRGLHALMPHGDAVGDGDGAEFARRAVRRRHALLHRLRLAHQRNVARRSFVPTGGDADKGLMDLLTRETHGVVIGTMGSPGGTLGDVPAGQTRLIERLCVHLNARMRCKEKRVVPRHRYSLKSALVTGSRPRENLATYSGRALLVQTLISQSFMAQTGRKCRSPWYLGNRMKNLCKLEG